MIVLQESSLCLHKRTEGTDWPLLYSYTEEATCSCNTPEASYFPVSWQARGQSLGSDTCLQVSEPNSGPSKPTSLPLAAIANWADPAGGCGTSELPSFFPSLLGNLNQNKQVEEAGSRQRQGLVNLQKMVVGCKLSEDYIKILWHRFKSQIQNYKEYPW